MAGSGGRRSEQQHRKIAIGAVVVVVGILQFYKEKLNEGDNSVWDRWEYEEEYSTLREEATGFLSAHRNPRRPRQPGYCDPLAFIRWAFKEHAVPTTDLGPVHGDLHGRNILVGLKDGQACFPVVFDYSAMSASQPMVWDFVGLEVDLKSHTLPDLALDEQARQALAMATTHRLRSTRHGQTAVELISRSKRADLNRSERIEFAYQFELLLTDLLFNQEVIEHQSPDDREPQTGHPALDRALQLIRRIRREAAITLIHSLHRLAAWQNEYLFALAVCGLSKIQQPLAAHQLEWCLIASGVASANLDSFSRFVATENDIALQLDSEFAIPTFLYAGKLPAELERREDTLIFTIPSGDIEGERFPFCGAGAHQSRGLEPIGPFLKQPGIRHLIIDFSQMDYISSTNVFQLVELWKHVKERDGQMVLCGLTPKFQEFVKINNLNTLWSVYPDQAEALKALHGESDGSL